MINSNLWSEDIEDILSRLKLNSKKLSEYHKNKYYQYKNKLKFFKIPSIILSAFISVASVGLTVYLNQQNTNTTICCLSLMNGLINSIELYYGINKNMEMELEISKKYLLLSYNINKMLLLNRDNREVGGIIFLNDIYSQYNKLIEQSNLIKAKFIKDALVDIPTNYASSGSTISTNSDESLQV